MRRSRSLVLLVVAVLAAGTMAGAGWAAPGVQRGDVATTIDAVNLRAEASWDAAILGVVPADSDVAVEGPAIAGFVPVTVEGVFGWIFGMYLDTGATQTATTTEDLTLRVAPSMDADAILRLGPGETVTLTAGSSGDFVSVAVGGNYGWVLAAYLSLDGSGGGGGGGGNEGGGGPIQAATATDFLNLRAGPGLDEAILLVVPRGATVETTGDPADGFYPAGYAGTTGWLSGQYLDFNGGGGGGPVSIAWPFEDGTEWWITQGYDGPWSHWNASSRYQYRFSLDLRRTEGWSAGQAVLSPATGTIRWIDRGSGGMSIDLGNGYAVAFYHAYLTGGLDEGQQVSQGQFLGTIAEPGDAANGGISHLHLTLWRTNDGGNENRIAAPFTGDYAIEGVDLPDIGGSDAHWGTVIQA